MKIYPSDLHDAPLFGKRGYCARVSREFAKVNALDWWDFVQNGIDEEILAATGDALALALIEHVRQKHGQE